VPQGWWGYGMSVVRCVTGDMAAAAVGTVMFHEHLLFNFVPPGTDTRSAVPITPENRWQIDYLSNANPTNARQDDPAVAAAELAAFRADGGGLIVDQSVIGIGRDPAGLVSASQASGVAVVAATGTYTARYLPPELREAGVDDLAALFLTEIQDGIDNTGIRAGLIGEIGISWPPEPVEERALQAAAIAQQQTGVAISVHPGRSPAACTRILDVLQDAGADLTRVVLCHMDRTHPDGTGIAALLARGAVIEWDFFGIEQSHYWMDETELPTDLQRLRLIRDFAARGHWAQIVISQDICTRTRMTRWGGHGYGHVLRNLPALMARLEFPAGLIEALQRTTPLRLLTLKETPA
jgi:phosphotriesterase-related protein